MRFTVSLRREAAANTSTPMANPLFPFPDRPRSVFSALGEKANS
jgi:hypothetical protein